MNGNKIIVHTLIRTNNGYLVTKRSKEELKHLKIIFKIMSEHFHSKDEKQNINRVLELQKRFSLPNSSNK